MKAKRNFLLLVIVSLVTLCILFTYTHSLFDFIPKFEFHADKETLSIYTFADKPSEMFCLSVESAIANGVTLHVLGLDGGLSDELDQFDKKLLKPHMFLQAAKHAVQKYGTNHIVMIVDAFDVLFQQPPQYFLDRFRSFNHPIVYSAENNCWPFASGELHPQHPMCVAQRQMSPEMVAVYLGKGRPVHYINTGAVIGLAGHLVDWFSNATAMMKFHSFVDDQELGARMMVEGNYSIALDVRSSMFMSMNDATEILEQYRTSRLFRNKATGFTPGLLHFNGDKSTINDFSQKLWFRTPEKFSIAKIKDGKVYRENNLVAYSTICPDI